MTTYDPSQPIGIFDSGIGGLTIAKPIINSMPSEKIIYFGDTAHLPYGDKSAAAIQAYSIKIVQMLLQKKCKLILIACNSASAAAYDLIKEYVNHDALIVNVIDPVIEFIKQHYAHKHIGVIGTKQTIHSNIYKKKIEELNLDITLHSHATPLLAKAIEDGFANSIITDALLHEYLSQPALQQIDALILGCTHYPIVKKKIAAFYKGKIDLIDPSEIVTNHVKNILEKENLINKKNIGSTHFYVSDYTLSFMEETRFFMNRNVTLEHYPLWVRED